MMNVLIVLSSCLIIQGIDRFLVFSQEIIQSSTLLTDDRTVLFTSISIDETTMWTSSYPIDNNIVPSKQQWININRNSSLQWRKVNDDSNTYLIRSEGQCLKQLCEIKLQYNGSLIKNKEGCLSFLLWIHGQPIGQLWVEEDEEKESFSQKIQLTNSTLSIQHSFQSNLKQLSIDGRILFRNVQEDTITLSNLTIDWNGPCPKYSSRTSLEAVTLTSEQEWQTSPSTSDDQFETNESTDDPLPSSTDTFVKAKVNSPSKSLLNERNLGWFLSLIVIFCLLIISLSFLYGIWSIQRHYRHIWYLPYERPIQFLWRRSIRSSTRSERPIQSLAQIFDDLQVEFSQDSIPISTTKTTPSTSFMSDSVLF